MKTHSVLFLILMLFFFSCTKNQYVYFNSISTQSKDPFILKNDTLEIAYDFSGRDCPVNVTIFNKSDEPIYVDWKKSVAIIDEEKIDYYDHTKSFSGESREVDDYGSFDGQIFSDERVTFIPPSTKFRTTRAHLCQYFENLPRPKKLRVPLNVGKTNIKFYHFNPEVSPLKFKSLLTLSSKETFNDGARFESEFYISEIVESSHDTYKLNPSLLSNPETIYIEGAKSTVSKATGFTNFVTWGIVLPSLIFISVYVDEE